MNQRREEPKPHLTDVWGKTEQYKRVCSNKHAIPRVISNYWQSFCKHIWLPRVSLNLLWIVLSSYVP